MIPRPEIMPLNTVIVLVYGGYTMTVYLDMAILALLMVNTVVILLFLRKIAQIIVVSSQKLSEDTALALQATVTQILEGNFDLPDIQPPNVFQQMIVEMIQKRMNPQIEVTEIARSEDGKFKSQDISL